MEQSRLNERLIKASEDGDINKVKQLIEYGANVNHANNYGYTPLLWASRYGHFEIVKYLTEHGANVNHVSKGGYTPLLWASRDGHFEIVKYLTEHGADVNHANNNGSTPLIWASNNGHLEIVKYLIEHGAKVNHPDNFGYTPLIWASREGNLEIVKYLISKGADWTPIKNTAIFQEIIKEETNNLKDKLTKNYLTIERSTPQTITGEGKVKSLLPENLLLKTIYEKEYQELCVPYGEGVPPIQLLALANILKLDYSIDITWHDLCNRVKNVLYLLL